MKTVSLLQQKILPKTLVSTKIMENRGGSQRIMRKEKIWKRSETGQMKT